MDFTEILSLALKALTERAILLISMGMVFGLFAWAINIATWLALATAATFAVLVFLPLLVRGSKGVPKAADE